MSGDAQLALFGSGDTTPASPLPAQEPKPAPTAEPTPANPVAPTKPLPPAGTAADAHAAIITEDGCFAPSGRPRRTGRPVESVDILAQLLTWLNLKPAGKEGNGGIAQVYIVGEDALDILGWKIDPGHEDDFEDMESLRDQAATTLATAIRLTLGPLNDHGWFLRKNSDGQEKQPGHYINLIRRTDNTLMLVDVILEPYSWTYPYRDIGWRGRIGGLGIFGNPRHDTYLPDDTAAGRAELGRRLDWCVTHLDVLPGPTPARTGAAIQDRIVKTRTRTGRGVVVTEAGRIPPLNNVPHNSDIESPIVWSRVGIDPAELENAVALVTIDQRAAYLASAGMLSLGYGEPQHLANGDAIIDTIRSKKAAPFGLYRVEPPALNSLHLPDKLPPLLPVMDPTRTDPNRPVDTWVTGISIDHLQAPVSDGGAGLDLDDLGLSEAWIWPEEGRALEAWKKALAPARTQAIATSDKVMKHFVSDVYRAYIGRMRTDKWDERYAYHCQPVWWFTVVAHCRWRGRRVAMNNSRTPGLWPLHTATDSWVYAVPAGVDLADPSEDLGKMDVEKHVPLTDDIRAALLAAQTPNEMRTAILAAFGDSDDDNDE